MSCVLRLSAPDIEGRVSTVSIRPYRLESGTAHFQVSQCDFEDFPGQVDDALSYLKQNARDLERLLKAGAEGSLDFAVQSPVQGFATRSFPAALVSLAGALGIALDFSVYPEE
jgi:hypothetical protein